MCGFLEESVDKRRRGYIGGASCIIARARRSHPSHMFVSFKVRRNSFKVLVAAVVVVVLRGHLARSGVLSGAIVARC